METKLEKAKRLYYNGIVFMSADSNQRCVSNGDIINGFPSESIFSNGSGCVYTSISDEWADIISAEKPLIISEEKEFIPYGIDWKNELKTKPKDFLVDFLRNSLIKISKLEKENAKLSAHSPNGQRLNTSEEIIV
jgi:hypothetical protein